MNIEFEKKIKEFIDRGEILFYNNEGNPKAFKLCVRHISSAPSFQKGIIINNVVNPFDTILIVDFENETIIETENPIEVIPLTYL